MAITGCFGDGSLKNFDLVASVKELGRINMTDEDGYY